MAKHETWFRLHLPDERARRMTREEYYATRSWLRRCQHILHLRYANAKIDNGNTIMMPATAEVLPARFQ